MNFAEIDFTSFCEVLKSMKQEIEAEIKKDPKIDDESHVLLESINILIKELKGIESYDNLDREKKVKVLPHLSLVFVFTRSLYEDEEGDYDDEDEADIEMLEGCDEGECDEEETHGKGKLPMSSNQCCGGHHHHHHDDHKHPKGKK